jgi:uncharacterized protein YggE
MLKGLVCFLLVFSLILPANAALLKGDKTQLLVSGKGIIRAESDLAYIMVGIERTEKTATQAQEIAAKKMKNILASLEKVGIPKDKIKTMGFRLYPKYEYDRGKRTLVGYTASNQIKVTLDDLEKVGKVIDTAITAGANNVGNITFTVKDEAPHKKEALQKAFKDAEGKAEAIASASGLILSRIKSIQEAGARVIPAVSGVRAMRAEGLGAAAVETPIVPGKIEIRGNLTVVYECAKK